MPPIDVELEILSSYAKAGIANAIPALVLLDISHISPYNYVLTHRTDVLFLLNTKPKPLDQWLSALVFFSYLLVVILIRVIIEIVVEYDPENIHTDPEGALLLESIPESPS